MSKKIKATLSYRSDDIIAFCDFSSPKRPRKKPDFVVNLSGDYFMDITEYWFDAMLVTEDKDSPCPLIECPLTGGLLRLDQFYSNSFRYEDKDVQDAYSNYKINREFEKQILNAKPASKRKKK